MLASPRLRRLKLVTCFGVMDSCITSLAKHCPNLTALFLLHMPQLQKPTLEHPSLQELAFTSCPNLHPDTVLYAAAHCQNLKHCTVTCCNKIAAECILHEKKE